MYAGEPQTTQEAPRQRQIRALAELARAALLDGGRAELFELAVRAIASGLAAPSAAVMELEVYPDERKLRVRAEVGGEPDVRERLFPIGSDSQSRLVLELNAPVVSEDLATERRFRVGEYRNTHNLVSTICGPIAGPQGPLGVAIAGFTEKRQFEPSELDFVTSVGEVLGAALTRVERDRKLVRSRQLFDVMQDAVLVMRSDGKLLDANAQALALYGYTRDELLERSILDLRASSSLPDFLWQLRRAGATGLLFETQHRRKDGSVFPCEVSSRGAMLEGEHVLVSVVRTRPE